MQYIFTIYAKIFPFKHQNTNILPYLTKQLLNVSQTDPLFLYSSILLLFTWVRKTIKPALFQAIMSGYFNSFSKMSLATLTFLFIPPWILMHSIFFPLFFLPLLWGDVEQKKNEVAKFPTGYRRKRVVNAGLEGIFSFSFMMKGKIYILVIVNLENKMSRLTIIS